MRSPKEFVNCYTQRLPASLVTFPVKRRVQCHACICPVKDSIYDRATGVHSLGQGGFGNAGFFHRLTELPCDQAFDCDSGHFFNFTFLGKKIVKTTTNISMPFNLLSSFHRSQSFF